ncbi:MAG: pantetheine-phosphate adenylyltransferase [Liquorilactobacillus ghanensis]|uniref:Phosphopantetheine adenylyltransferase n=1 Tax=Liquorilactobacillus ghanensis DSM 18630 TaxID=1423750 RepID=A0A0R1VXD2_9LACO|nr:pantetheine-phosphate adenylyltransferase [Liquorilactobacillus ghanensis]KRM07699.1 phosphopantetheine adenylyltransferase [Liquorilactobacillus ghanensis DSM 18630]
MIAVFPGSFDPVTNGHLDVIRRAAALFDRVVVLIMKNTAKKGLFTVEERVKLLNQVVAEQKLHRVEISAATDRLTVDAVRSLGGQVIIRGVRNERDFSFERDIAELNRRLAPEIETLLLPTSPELAVISSSYVKEIAQFGGELSSLVASPVARALQERFD